MFCINFGSPRVLEQITTPQLERTLVMLKERKKKMQRMGSYLQHYVDRDMFYQMMQGPKGSKFIIQRQYDRKHYNHRMETHDKYEVRTMRTRNAWYDHKGITNQRWDCTVHSCNPLFDGCQRWNLKGITKDNAIALFERWGVKAVVIDEMRRPNQGDMKYFKHRLYAHNFPWVRDPVTNRYKGDADWSWKGEDVVDYGSPVAGDFISLWRDAVDRHAIAAPVQAAAAPVSTPKAAPPVDVPAPVSAAKVDTPVNSAKVDSTPKAAAPIVAAKTDAAVASSKETEAEVEAEDAVDESSETPKNGNGKAKKTKKGGKKA